MFEGVKLDECCSTCFPWNMESAAKRGTATPPRHRQYNGAMPVSNFKRRFARYDHCLYQARQSPDAISTFFHLPVSTIDRGV